MLFPSKHALQLKYVNLSECDLTYIPYSYTNIYELTNEHVMYPIFIWWEQSTKLWQYTHQGSIIISAADVHFIPSVVTA